MRSRPFIRLHANMKFNFVRPFRESCRHDQMETTQWWTDMLRLISAHFERHRKRTNNAFFVYVLCEGILISFVAFLLLRIATSAGSRTDLAQLSIKPLLFAALVLAPLVETIILQGIPVFLFRKSNFWNQVWVATLVFASAHFPQGFGSGVVAGIIGGFYLSFAYAHWKQRSWREAFWLTSAMHAVRNGIMISFALYCN